ncbi:MAG: hypothetical protein LBS23_03795, partial [Holosporaceae bacterium]|nr:hypothetical protein [Holosporaceae bacterium]
IVDKTYKRAQKILENHKDILELLAQNLLEHETLTGEEIKKILDGEKIEKPKKTETTSRIGKSKMPTFKDVDQNGHSPKRRRQSMKEAQPSSN